ncbi:MAG TPA: PHP domain-containing protein, partial [Saprospiraceae bacterium]|nr:PHP domain-containing protein [Saprospiraceae bacterium]
MDIESLARHVMDHYAYDYIVLTDHSKSSRIAGGKEEKDFIRQMKEIDRINSKLGKAFIKKGVEVDILPDGQLDFSDSLLSKMDWVCASIHAGFRKDNTGRLVAACQNPYVSCLGHPSGRLIGKREPYKVDWKQVFIAASRTGTAIEINSQPDRMDLNDILARQAVEAGVMLTISTDSHAAEHFDFMRLGVTVARRAWCEPKHILNTRPWKEVEAFAKKKRAKLLVHAKA